MSGCVFIHAKGAITWRCKLQTITAQSTVEAEYVALSFAVREALWLRKLLPEIYGQDLGLPMKLHEDNMECISVAKDDVLKENNKHIDVKYQLIMEHVKKGNIVLKYTETGKMVADVFTKSL